MRSPSAFRWARKRPSRFSHAHLRTFGMASRPSRRASRRRGFNGSRSRRTTMSDFQRSDEDRDPIADLLRLAGPRTVVPVERGERVKAAAREAWLGSVKRRARARILVGLAMAAGLAALAFAVP